MTPDPLNTPLIEHSPLAVYVSDRQGRILLANPAASRMTGYGVDELESMNVMDVDAVHNTLETLQRIWDNLPYDQAITAISKHRTKEGGFLDVEVNLSKVRIDEQELFCAHVKDITEDLAIRNDLERNHEMLDKLARQVPGVVYQYRLYPDLRSCFPYSSPGMWDIYRYHPEDVIEDATPVFGRLHPEDIDRVSKDIFRSAEELSLFECRFRVILPDVGVQWRHSNARPERLPDGSTLWYGIITDITKQVEAEQEVIKLSSAIEQSPATVVITDLQGRIEYVNPKFTALTGYTAEEALGHNPNVLKSGAQSDSYYKELWTTISAGNVWRGQFQNRKKNGELYWESATISPIRDLNGTITHYLAVKEDITAAVQNLERIQKLLTIEEEQNKRLRNFTHIVSHNLRSHTANMAGVLGLIEMEEPELLNDLYVGMLKTSADNLSETILNLNAVLDINLGNNVTWSFQNLHHVAQTAISSVSTLAESSGVRLINDIPEDLTLFGIAAYLDSIVLNMLTNGIKFRGPNRDAYVRLSAVQQGKNTVLTVEDNGLGIDLEMHGTKVFGLYKTFHQNTDSKGLGLFITKNQIEAMGGTIIVSSQVDVGTTFIITLPNQKP